MEGETLLLLCRWTAKCPSLVQRSSTECVESECDKYYNEVPSNTTRVPTVRQLFVY
jgi:hypothetical protein